MCVFLLSNFIIEFADLYVFTMRFLNRILHLKLENSSYFIVLDFFVLKYLLPLFKKQNRGMPQKGM